MSRKINKVLCALVTLFLVASMQTASATAPQISVISINKSSVERGDSLVVQYRITDDGPCCNPHDVYMYDSSGAWVTRVQGSRISGTDQNSTWRADITVPVNSVGQNSGRALAAGTYSFKTQTTDAQNNYSDLVLLGTVRLVDETPTAPQISVISISKSSVARGSSLSVQYRITDDGSCCNPHDVYVYDPSGAWVTRVQGSRISGTDQNSNWSANISIPVSSVGQNSGRALAAGTYSIKTQTTDSQNNYSDLVLLGTVTVTVTSSTPSPTPTPSPTSSPNLTDGVDIEPNEEFLHSVEARFIGGKTRFVVSGNPNTNYKVQASSKGKRKTFSIVTDSDGEIVFKTSRNLRNYNIRLILDGEVLARATAR